MSYEKTKELVDVVAAAADEFFSKLQKDEKITRVICKDLNCDKSLLIRFFAINESAIKHYWNGLLLEYAAQEVILRDLSDYEPYYIVNLFSEPKSSFFNPDELELAKKVESIVRDGDVLNDPVAKIQDFLYKNTDMEPTGDFAGIYFSGGVIEYWTGNLARGLKTFAAFVADDRTA